MSEGNNPEAPAPQRALSTKSAQKLATTTKTPPQMTGATPRWLLQLLPWVEVKAGTYRINRRQVVVDEEHAVNDHGEKNIEINSGHEGEHALGSTYVDLDDAPLEFPLSIAQTVLRVHTRVADLYNDPYEQVEQQLRLIVEGLKERQEREVVNNETFGLLSQAAGSMKVATRTGPPTPDDMDELLSMVWKTPSFFLAHPRAIAAFGRECTARGVPPEVVHMHGGAFLTWRGVPIVPCDKLGVEDGTTNILLMRTGEQARGVVGLHRPGVDEERLPSLSVRFMGIDDQAIGSYLVTLYFSAAVLVPDALGVLTGVDVNHYPALRSRRRAPKRLQSALCVEGGQRVEIKRALAPIVDAVTLEFWVRGGEKLPANTVLFEAINAANQRVLNIHLPWSNGHVYWDAGNEGAAYDRIEKGASPGEYLKRWVHWAFVKDANAGVMSIYRDGNLWHREQAKHRKMEPISAAYLGAFINGSDPWSGRIAEFRVWNTARSTVAIQDNFRARLRGDEPGLVALWPLDALTGTEEAPTVSDLVSARRDAVQGATISADLALPIGASTPFDRVTRFDGSGRIDVAKGAPTLSDAITVEFWAKGDKLPAATSVIAATNASNQRVFNIHLPWSNGAVYWDAGNKGAAYDRIDKAAAPHDYRGQWTHWAFVKDATKGVMSIYRDGELWHRGEGLHRTFEPIAALSIGDMCGQHRWSGWLAELRIWDVAREQDEIKATRYKRLGKGEQGLVACWPLNATEQVGATSVARELVGGIEGIIHAAPLDLDDELPLGELQPVSVLEFLGDGRIEVPDHERLRTLTYTVECWMRPRDQPTAMTWQGVVGKPGRNFNLWLHSSGYLHHSFHNGASTNSGAPNSPVGSTAWNQWQHVAITNDGTTATSYINGEEVARGPSGGMLADATALIIAGNLDGAAGNHFRGELAELRLWGVARSQEEILETLRARATGREPELIACWPLDQIVQGDGAQTVVDLTGNHPGTVNGGVQIVQARLLLR
jgi:hypothetical protein